MLEKDVFIELLESAQSLDKVMNGLDKALGIQMCDSYLLDAQTKLLDLLVSKCEDLEKGEDPYIYIFAFNNKWGEVPDTQYIGATRYVVDSFDTLFDYLTALKSAV
jgi:hypothetical protein